MAIASLLKKKNEKENKEKEARIKKKEEKEMSKWIESLKKS